VVPNAVPVQSILDLAEEVPFNVQMLAHNCWEELRSKGGSSSPNSPCKSLKQLCGER